MFNQLNEAKRVLIKAEFSPVQGNRFQPTGFPDIGAATYQLADGTRMLLVESAQSMANRLEDTIIGPDNEVIEAFKGLPYIRVKLTGGTETKTNSLIEAHRINSPFIISDEGFKDKFKKVAGYKKGEPINWQQVAKALFFYDVNSLLHGAFLANLEDGRLKIPRALSAFIEARNVRDVVSGGVKNNPIDPTGKLRAANYDKDVYGNVPYSRMEYTAESITGYFNLDVGMLKSYNLGQDAYDLLVALAIYKICSFLEGGTRLRTACDLKLSGEPVVTEPDGFKLPGTDKLMPFIQSKIKACENMFSKPPVIQITTSVIVKSKKDKTAVEAEEE